VARGVELRRHKGGGIPRKFLNIKSKNGAFLCILSIYFKVCRLITETVSDRVRKTVTNRLCFPPLFPAEPQRQETGSIAIADTSSTFYTLHYRTAQGIAVDTLKWKKDRFKSS